MLSDKFETAFESFLQDNEYEKAESCLFSIVRLAFGAGWKAAGGECEKMAKEQE